MSHYKKNASSNRDALFGGASSSSKEQKSIGRPTSSRSSSNPSVSNRPTSSGYSYSSEAPKTTTKIAKAPSLSAEARIAKLKEAELNRDKGNDCLKSGLFKSADHVAATTFFKRAADAYKTLGDVKMEKAYRIQTAQCNTVTTAWASAAEDYRRAAELAETPQEASEYYQQAARCWTELTETTKAAACMVESAVVLIDKTLDNDSWSQLEAAVEAHVPDPLNAFARYRQTGLSKFLDPDSDETILNVSPSTLELAKQHLVGASYAHEPVQKIVGIFCDHSQYASALYAAGAVTKILSSDNVSTISLSRAYCVETILCLAMGDPVLAEQQFLNVHVQSDSYLKSRECALAEDLIKAVKHRDIDELEEARDTVGAHRAALSNLDESVRKVVFELRISGVAKSQLPRHDEDEGPGQLKHPDMPLNELLAKNTGYEIDENLDEAALDAELDALDLSNTQEEEEELSDDDIDLR